MLPNRSTEHRVHFQRTPMKKLAYTCYVDNQTRYKKQAIRFIYSLLRSGINIDDIFVSLSDDIEQEYLRLLSDLIGVKNLSIHKNFTETSKPANKWLQLNQDSFDGYTHVSLNDCDKVYIDFDDNWATNSVRACKFVPRPTYNVFKKIFENYNLGNPRFTLEKPDPRDKHADPRNYVNNHNGGLIIIPAHLIELVTQTWKKYIDLLLADIDQLGDNGRNLDQIAFSMAMELLGEDINHLPKSLDIGIGVRNLSEHLLKPKTGQLVLHIHGDEDDKSMIVCRENTDPNLAKLVSSFNCSYLEWIETVGLKHYIEKS